ncbi:MAG: lysophospholipase [Anaerolineae bacterium]|nr:lysophospholipase [Anaerolineae bacterium]MDW8171675.1 alpha/beta hydrolase [Anaerolineae bacterium]
MTHYETRLMKAQDGTQLFAHAWLPPRGPEKVLFIAHGIGEHAGRYDHLARALNEDKIAVFALDHRGHGRSAGLRAYFDDFGQPVRDLRQFWEETAMHYGGNPMHLYGHSMGSIIALMFALQYPHFLSGLILTGTATTVEETQPTALIQVSLLIGSILPKLRSVQRIDISTLSTDLNTQRAYKADPLNDGKAIRFGMARGIILNGRAILQRAEELRLPLLIMHGADDKLTPPSGSQAVYDRVGSEDKTLRIWPGMRHELINEVDRQAVIQAMRDWLMKH